MTSPCSNGAGFLLPLDRSGVLHNEFSPLFVRASGPWRPSAAARYVEPQCLFPAAKPSPDVDLLKRYCQAFKTLLASHVKMEDVILSNKRRRRQSRDVEEMLKSLNEIVSTPLKVRMSLGGAGGDNVNLVERVAPAPAPAPAPASIASKSPRKAPTPSSSRLQEASLRREKRWSSSSSKVPATTPSARSPARITQRKSAQRRGPGGGLGLSPPRPASASSLARSSPALAAAASRGRDHAAASAASDPFTLYFSLTTTPGSGSKAVLPLSMPTPSDLLALQAVTDEVQRELQGNMGGLVVSHKEEGGGTAPASRPSPSPSRPFSSPAPSRLSLGGGGAVRLRSAVRPGFAIDFRYENGVGGGGAVRSATPRTGGGLGLGGGSRGARLAAAPHCSPRRSPRPAPSSRPGAGAGAGFGSSAPTDRATTPRTLALSPFPRSPRPSPASTSTSASSRRLRSEPGPASARRALLETADSLVAEIDSALML